MYSVMEKRRLGTTGYEVTAVGWVPGTSAATGGDVPEADDEARRPVEAALDADAGVERVEEPFKAVDHDAVSTVIPGSPKPEHVRQNVGAADVESLSRRTHGAVRDVYEVHVKAPVHHRW
jgi:aryl-alcohol dehydrogenase-like predicted oxidoreductase